MIAVPVLTALAHLIEVLAVVLGIVLSVAVLAVAALVAYRIRRGRAPLALPVHRAQALPGQAAEPLPGPRRPAISAPKQELHLHFHGVTAEDVASIIAERNRPDGPRV